MKLAILDTSKYGLPSQRRKITEEFLELREANNKCDEIAEALDLIQATVSYINKIATTREIIKAIRQHNKKLLGRGWKIEKYFKIKGE